MSVVASAAALLALVGCYGLSQTIAPRAPSAALRLNPFNSVALGKLAMVEFQGGGAGVQTADALSRRAVAINPTAVAAVRTLAFVTAARGDEPRAELMIQHAEQLSRRDTGTQLWLIEREVARDNIPGALRHYDIALTTSRSIRQMLLPILVNSTKTPAIIQPLAAHLANRPVWRQEFVNALLADAPDAAAAAALSRALDARGSPLELTEKTALSNRLIEERLYLDAARLLGRTRDPALVTNGAFREGETGNPFNWRLRHDFDLSGEIAQEGGASGLLAFAGPRRGGDIAQQLLMLRPGRYRVATTLDPERPPPTAPPFWTVTCAAGEQIAAIDIESRDRSGISAAAVTIPPGCPAQWLVLHLRPGASDGSELLFRQVAITPL